MALPSFGDMKCSDIPKDTDARAECEQCERADQRKIQEFTGIVQNHNPESLIGNAFLWEKHPDEKGDLVGATQSGGGNGNSGLFDNQIIEKYEQSIDVMREGAGLGFLFPHILANRAEIQEGLPAIELYDNPSVPHLKACFTNSRHALGLTI